MRVVLAYKNFAANRAVSHIGLGVTSLNAAKSLRDFGVAAEVWAIVRAAELTARLRAAAIDHATW